MRSEALACWLAFLFGEETAGNTLAEVREQERRLADLVNQAYGLSLEEIDLLWRTAPPRMRVGQPEGLRP